MATASGGTKALNFLKTLGNKIANAAGAPLEVRVGFLEGAKYPDGTSVAMVAAIQNFGAPAVGVPPRPFLS